MSFDTHEAAFFWHCVQTSTYDEALYVGDPATLGGIGPGACEAGPTLCLRLHGGLAKTRRCGINRIMTVAQVNPMARRCCTLPHGDSRLLAG